jgi:hypothetical protein
MTGVVISPKERSSGVVISEESADEELEEVSFALTKAKPALKCYSEIFCLYTVQMPNIGWHPKKVMDGRSLKG